MWHEFAIEVCLMVAQESATVYCPFGQVGTYMDYAASLTLKETAKGSTEVNRETNRGGIYGITLIKLYFCRVRLLLYFEY